MKDELRAAIANIGKTGDTDVFPHPFETHLFYDDPERVLTLLDTIHMTFDDYFDARPPYFEQSLLPIGYGGFRWATTIDPLWNSYLLALTLSLFPKIELARMPMSDGYVYSYRISEEPHSDRIFREDGWALFRDRTKDLADTHNFVLSCDIADFYGRIYHHRLENGLKRLQDLGDSTSRIMKILGVLSGGNSYGLPVGGPAARILSELVLNPTDRLFRAEGLRFCRFADDYRFFANSMEEAHAIHYMVSEKLLRLEGLSLQKSKTRIMTSSEFLLSTDMHDDPDNDDIPDMSTRRFLKLSLRFDPYSPSAYQDYEDLREEVGRFDIVGMLASELQKSRVHVALTRRLIRALRFLSDPIRDQAVMSIMASLRVLQPLLTSVLITVKQLYENLGEKSQQFCYEAILKALREDSYLFRSEIVKAYAVRVLSARHTYEAEQIVSKMYHESQTDFLRRDIVLVFAKWRTTHWLSDVRTRFHILGPSERRAFIVSSFVLGDEGTHWRRNSKDVFTPFEDAISSWTADKKSAGLQDWDIPI
ncbi:hypothetical protein AYO38_12060 [bacterium SCGC AG-212-C10]|nr:hypothetical protein AYO38_12060 [bacterium SCGC AG-212-C10]